MKKMNFKGMAMKALALLVLGAITFSLSACGEEDDENEKELNAGLLKQWKMVSNTVAFDEKSASADYLLEEFSHEGFNTILDLSTPGRFKILAEMKQTLQDTDGNIYKKGNVYTLWNGVVGTSPDQSEFVINEKSNVCFFCFNRNEELEFSGEPGTPYTYMIKGNKMFWTHRELLKGPEFEVVSGLKSVGNLDIRNVKKIRL